MTYKLTNTSQPADPYYGAVSLLLHGDGADGSTQIIDSSVNPKTVTVNGNAQISTTESKFNGSSLKFDGSGDYVEVNGTNTSLEMGGDSWTVEMWIYQIARPSNAATIYDSLGLNGAATNAIRIRIDSLGYLKFLRYSSTVLSSSAAIPLTTWTHVAVVKDGSTLNVYLSGALVGSIGDTVTYTNGLNRPILGVDGYSPPTAAFNGYIDDLRVTKGVARYTANFTPPTQPFQSLSVRDPQFNAVSLLLKGDGTNGSTTIFDSSPTPKTVTAVGNAQISTAQSKFNNSSLKFDGTGDYLSTGPDSNLALGSGDFTVEAFIYVTSLSSDSVIASSRALNVSGDLYWNFTVSSTGQLTFQSRSLTGTQYFARSATSEITTNTWYHVAAVRQSNVLTVYVNGVAGPTTVNDGGNDLTESYVGVGIFNYPGFVKYFPGYIDDFRITKGVARYTSNFTPPGPLPTY